MTQIVRQTHADFFFSDSGDDDVKCLFLSTVFLATLTLDDVELEELTELVELRLEVELLRRVCKEKFTMNVYSK